MSISASLSNALSGLTAASRAAEVVSANVANSRTEGYGRRELQLASRTVGGNGAGVSVVNVTRAVDERVVADRRLADASLGMVSASADFFQDLESILGLPDDPASITGRMSQFESALLEAASRPDSEPRLDAVLSAVKGIATKLNSASAQIQNQRLQADQDINSSVEMLNDNLKNVQILNNNIRTQLASGYDATALMDQRQQLIDGISDIVPIRQVPRGNGEIALFTTGGAILLDGKPAEIGFTPVGTIVPQMTIGSSALSGLTLNGQVVPTGPEGPLGGGRLAGSFQVRDDHAVVAQERLDAVARDLISRFEDPAVDPTLGVTSPGLFTDAGAQFNSAIEVGLSGRLAVNSLVDPISGGQIWRLRDGLGAVSPGDVGNASLLVSLTDAFGSSRIPASGGFSGAARSAIGLAGDVVSLTNTQLRSTETEQSFSSALATTLKQSELQSGVDTDHELQQLMLIEQAYSANALVISTIDDMINVLLGL